MEDKELQKKISELEELAGEIPKLYADFFEECKIGEYRVTHDTGKSVKDTHWKKFGDAGSMAKAIRKYEEWFSQAEVLVKNYYSDRYEEFVDLGEEFKDGLLLRKKPPLSIDRHIQLQDANFFQQRSIVNAIPERKSVAKLRFRKTIKQNLAKQEIQRAKALLKDDLISPAGVTAGVALERHMITIIEEKSDIEEYNRKIASLAQKLRDKELINEPKRKEIVHLGDLRNRCAHANEDTPEIREVERMIRDIDEFIRSK